MSFVGDAEGELVRQLMKVVVVDGAVDGWLVFCDVVERLMLDDGVVVVL